MLTIDVKKAVTCQLKCSYWTQGDSPKFNKRPWMKNLLKISEFLNSSKDSGTGTGSRTFLEQKRTM